MNVGRRELLRSSVPVVLLPGCVGNGGQTDQKLFLDEIELVNATESEQCVSVTVTRDGERVHESDHCVGSEPPDNVVSVSRDWETQMAQYDVIVELLSVGEDVAARGGTNALRGDLGGVECLTVSATVHEDTIGIAQGYDEDC